MSRPIRHSIASALLLGLALSGTPATADRGPLGASEAPEVEVEVDDEAEVVVLPGDAEIAGCDSSAAGEAETPEEPQADAETPTLEPPAVQAWRTSPGRQCRRHNGRVVCDGPRRVPEPHGPAAERAAALGLDSESRAGRLGMNGPPDPAWLAAIDGEDGPGLLWPVPEGRLWRGFGRHRVLVRRGGRLRQGSRTRIHRGVDIGAAAGSAIRAVDDALVLYSFNGMRGYGNAVLLLHADGSVSLYAHCRATFVFAGQRVRRGQVIAEVGHTGLAHGDHLHFEWRRNGIARNPASHFVEVPERAPRGARRTQAASPP